MEETVIPIAEIMVFIVCLIILSIYLVIYHGKDKKKRVQLKQEEKTIDRTMPEHMKVIYATWPKDKIVLGNCPHCQCIMLTLHDKKFIYYCPSCSVYWHIKLVDNPVEVKHGSSKGSDESDQRDQQAI